MKTYQTNIPNIYAVGDVIGFPALASTSMEQARAAVVHAFDLKYKEHWLHFCLWRSMQSLRFRRLVSRRMTARRKIFPIWSGVPIMRKTRVDRSSAI